METDRNTTNTVTIANLIEGNFVRVPFVIKGFYQEIELTAEIEQDGIIKCNGETFNSLAGVTNHQLSVLKCPDTTVDGWRFWKCQNHLGEWTTLDSMRDVYREFFKNVAINAKISPHNVLMMKLKYEVGTPEDYNQFHAAVNKMFIGCVNKCPALKQKDDALMEIWKRVIERKNDWDETRGLHVTTWLWRVAVTVLGTQKYKESRLDVPLTSLDVTQSGESESETEFAENRIPDDTELQTSRMQLLDHVASVCETLDGKERMMAQLLMNPPEEMLTVVRHDGKTRNRKRLSKSEMATILGVSGINYDKMVKSLRNKLYDFSESVV